MYPLEWDVDIIHCLVRLWEGIMLYATWVTYGIELCYHGIELCYHSHEELHYLHLGLPMG